MTNPAIQHGVAQAPDYLLGVFLTDHSPFVGVSDLYPSQRLLTRATNGAPSVEIDRTIKLLTHGR